MNLFDELHKAGVTWNLSPVYEAWGASERPRSGQKLEVKVPGAESKPRIFLTMVSDVEKMLAIVLKEQHAGHPVLRAWLDSHGNTPVALEEGVLEGLFSCVQTALRKCSDTKQSIITWNGFHHLNSEDAQAYFTELEQLLTTVMAKERPPLRRAVAKAVQELTVRFFDERGYVELKDKEGRLVERSPLEKYVLKSMYAACCLMDMDEWMWGWLGYVLKDVELAPSEDSPQAG